jgi:hypothetical protein
MGGATFHNSFFIQFWLIIDFGFSYLPYDLLRPFLKYSPSNQSEVNAGLVEDVAPNPYGVIVARKGQATGYIPTAGKDRQSPCGTAWKAFGFESQQGGNATTIAEPVFAELYMKWAATKDEEMISG